MKLPKKATAGVRLLPDFLIVGAQKAGTSTMHSLLAAHPCIRSCSVKEPSFFYLKYDRGLLWYRSHFPTMLSKIFHTMTRDTKFLTFESTVSYLYDPHAAKRISTCLPDVKIIVMLRNHVDRAYSEFWYRRNVWNDYEFDTFEDAINFEMRTKIAEQEYKILQRDEEYPYHKFYRYSYLSRGIYAFQIENLFRYINKKQIRS
ncbi:MAG: sulfotransferase domain-containing protein [Conexivisphaerales archaeon]